LRGLPLPPNNGCMPVLRFLATSVAVVALLLLGCRKNPELTGRPSASARSSASLAGPARSAPSFGIPAPSSSVAKVVNPLGTLPYAGPTATLRGVVRVTGDPSPAADPTLPRVPASCAEANDFYGKLFREGPGRTLADVLVAATDYGQHYVPASGPTQRVVVHDCAWQSRTLALTFGQEIAVVNDGKKPHVPELLGAHSPARLVSIPRGDPVHLYPMNVGRYNLLDMMNIFMQVDVFVLKYATHAVTGLDGRYTISGLPAGEVTVNAFSPQAGLVEQRKVRLSAGQTAEADFTLHFDQQKYVADHPAPSSSAAAQPPPSASAPATHRL
jgi:hypothetical protein